MESRFRRQVFVAIAPIIDKEYIVSNQRPYPAAFYKIHSKEYNYGEAADLIINYLFS
jgi:hypothetical protein